MLVLPGFMTGDRSTVALRAAVSNCGCRPHAWRLGTNVGPTPVIMAGLARRLDELAQRSGRRVSLVGWSLGGLYARLLARRLPDHVRTVVTLGSPLTIADETRPLRDRLRAPERLLVEGLWQRRVPGFDLDTVEEIGRPEGDRVPISVPSTAVFGRLDRLVPRSAVRLPEGAHAENVEVMSSHGLLGFHPAALYVVMDRLAQPEGCWQPFAQRRFSPGGSAADDPRRDRLGRLSAARDGTESPASAPFGDDAARTRPRVEAAHR